jgi:purine nucleosidase
MCGPIPRPCTPFAAFMQGINRCVDEWARTSSGLAGYDLPDPVAMAVALRPDLATRVTEAHLAVSVAEPTRGMLLVDRRFRPLPPNASVVWSVDEARFEAMIFELAAKDVAPGIALPRSLHSAVSGAG